MGRILERVSSQIQMLDLYHPGQAFIAKMIQNIDLVHVIYCVGKAYMTLGGGGDSFQQRLIHVQVT